MQLQMNKKNLKNLEHIVWFKIRLADCKCTHVLMHKILAKELGRDNIHLSIKVLRI